MDQDLKTLPARVVVGQFNLVINLTDKRQMTTQGYFFEDDSTVDKHRRVDDMQDILNRQYAKADILTKQAELSSVRQGLMDMKKHYDGLVELVQSGKKLSSQQKTVVDQAEKNFESMKDRISSLEAAIKEAEKKVALE